MRKTTAIRNRRKRWLNPWRELRRQEQAAQHEQTDKDRAMCRLGWNAIEQHIRRYSGG